MLNVVIQLLGPVTITLEHFLSRVNPQAIVDDQAGEEPDNVGGELPVSFRDACVEVL